MIGYGWPIAGRHRAKPDCSSSAPACFSCELGADDPHLIALPNAKSVGLHEAMGFTELGIYREVGFKFGRWHDVGYWRLALTDHMPEADPIPFARLPTG